MIIQWLAATWEEFSATYLAGGGLGLEPLGAVALGTFPEIFCSFLLGSNKNSKVSFPKMFFLMETMKNWEIALKVESASVEISIFHVFLSAELGLCVHVEKVVYSPKK